MQKYEKIFYIKDYVEFFVTLRDYLIAYGRA